MAAGNFLLTESLTNILMGQSLLLLKLLLVIELSGFRDRKNVFRNKMTNKYGNGYSKWETQREREICTS